MKANALQGSRSTNSAGVTGPGCLAATAHPQAGGYRSAGGRDWLCKDALPPALCSSFSWSLLPLYSWCTDDTPTLVMHPALTCLQDSHYVIVMYCHGGST